jgi:hypothetical protein
MIMGVLQPAAELMQTAGNLRRIDDSVPASASSRDWQHYARGTDGTRDRQNQVGWAGSASANPAGRHTIAAEAAISGDPICRTPISGVDLDHGAFDECAVLSCHPRTGPRTSPEVMGPNDRKRCDDREG